MRSRKKSGFSLIELIIVVAVMAAIASAIIPSVSGATEAAKQQKAIAAAEAMNLAQIQWRLSPKGPLTSVGAWDSCTDDSQRYASISAYMQYADSWSNLSTEYEGYSFTFQGTTNDGTNRMRKVILSGPSGVVDY